MGRAGFRGRFRGPLRYLFDVPVVPDPGGHRRRRFGLPRGAIGPESPQPISRGERDAIAGCAGFGPAGAAKTKTWRRCPRFACGCTRPADVSRTNASSPDVWRRQNVIAAVPHPSAVRVFQSLAPRFCCLAASQCAKGEARERRGPPAAMQMWLVLWAAQRWRFRLPTCRTIAR